MTHPIAVCPYRFTTRTGEMKEFFETIGLRAAVTSTSGFAHLVAGSGSVAIHPLDPAVSATTAGHTQLTLLAPDAEDAAGRFSAAGFATRVWDESYGRHAGLTDPDGAAIWVNETQHDTYGYDAHDTSGVDPRVEVVMVRYSTDFASDRAFFQRIGFEPEPGADRWWEQLRADGDSGVIGLHHTEQVGASFRDSPADPVAPRIAVAAIGFQTSEPLAEVEARLTAAGYEARLREDGSAANVQVTDPDGQIIEIHSSRP